MSDMQQTCRKHGAAFLVTGAVYNEDNLPEWPMLGEDCKAAGVPFCSLDEKFRPDARPFLRDMATVAGTATSTAAALRPWPRS